MKLSPHFDLAEFVSEKDPVQPSADVLHNLEKLCEDVLEPLRAALGRSIKITSGYRSAKYNASIGGAKGSMHTTGMACDIAVGDVIEQIKVAAVASRLPGCGGIGLYESKGIVHVDIRNRVGNKPTYWFQDAKGRYVGLPAGIRSGIKVAGGKV